MTPRGPERSEGAEAHQEEDREARDAGAALSGRAGVGPRERIKERWPQRTAKEDDTALNERPAALPKKKTEDNT
jgi:hypothetical protein